MTYRHTRTPASDDSKPSAVTLRVNFKWHRLGRVTLSQPYNRIELPDVRRRPGVYRFSAWKNGGTIADDAWYVGQTMTDIDARIFDHLNDRYDPTTGQGKKFYDRIRETDGVCALDEARDIYWNDGLTDLVGMPDRRFPDAEGMAKLSPGDRQIVQFIMNAVEAVGQVTNLEYANAQGKR